MGKIVKFCSSCDEGFAEKFGFCPNCGQSLQAFEMNPVEAEAKIAPAAAPVAAVPVPPPTPILLTVPPAVERSAAPVEIEPEPILEVPVPVEEPTVEEPVMAEAEEPAEDALIEEPAAAEPVLAAPAAASFQTGKVNSAPGPQSFKPAFSGARADDGFHVTVIEGRNFGRRIGLLVLAFAVLQVVALMAGLVYNIFSKDLEVGSIDDDIFNAVIVDNVPAEVEEQKLEQKKDKGGGGGGGGRQEKEETTQGDLADQSKNPTRPPDAKVFRSDNFELKTPPPQTEGNRTFEKKFDRWGDPNGRFASFSNGTGSGGGQGTGTGTGQGSGRGTGAGSGDGSGSGGGIGSGNGNGRGIGDSDGGPPPVLPKGVTQPWRLISKPRPGYTDAARQANVQGTVVLKVVFLASGQVGSVSAIRGLPNGLTEQAIAAAKGIRFEPAMQNGVPQTVSKTIEYTFTIY